MTEILHIPESRFENSFFEKQLSTIILILSRYGFRISEVLNLSKSSLLFDNQIQVKISKTNDFILIRDEEIYNLLNSIFNVSTDNNFLCCYKDVYRYIKKFYPQLIIRNVNKNEIVCHSFRKRFAKKLKSLTNNENLIKNSLHHHSKSSQKYYLK